MTRCCSDKDSNQRPSNYESKTLKPSLVLHCIFSYHNRTIKCNLSCKEPYTAVPTVPKLRTANHKLPVEKGRYINLPREQRSCNLCNSDSIGDKFHFLLECPMLTDLRVKYIPKYYRKRPNFFKFSELLSLKKLKETTKCKQIY